jgi:hypothetical protein
MPPPNYYQQMPQPSYYPPTPQYQQSSYYPPQYYVEPSPQLSYTQQYSLPPNQYY